MWRPRRQLRILPPLLRAALLARTAHVGFLLGVLIGCLILGWLLL